MGKALTRDEAKETATKLGIEFNVRAKTVAIIALINEATGEEYTVKDETVIEPVKSPITTTADVGLDTVIPEADTVEDEAGEAGSTTGEVDGGDTVRCIIHSNDRDNAETEIRGGLNGETFRAQIGEEIDFPVKFMPCITDATADKQKAILNDDGQPTGKYKKYKHKRYILERV